MSIIRLENIAFSYNEKEIIHDFSLEIESEKTSCLLGSSGCGKTTILRLIAGLETPKKGKIWIDNQLVSDSGKTIIPPHKRKTGFVFQDLALWPHLTVYKNVAFGLSKLHKSEIKNSVNEILEYFDLENDSRKYPHQLSGGQQQLLAIARALILKPKILLMDEPLANLDVKLKTRMLNYIQEVKNLFKITLVYVTHDHKEAFSVSDNIIVLNQGRIEDSGSIKKLKTSENEYVKYSLEY